LIIDMGEMAIVTPAAPGCLPSSPIRLVSLDRELSGGNAKRASDGGAVDCPTGNYRDSFRKLRLRASAGKRRTLRKALQHRGR
jgi:hypothetical protein